jgi:hypothetical protein
VDIEIGKRIIALRGRVVGNFNAGNWEEVGLLTGQTDIINGHSRLLRSLSWNDEDYAGNVLEVLRMISEVDMTALDTFERYLNDNFPSEGYYISAKPAELKITFAPNVFQVPSVKIEPDLVAVMMPFLKDFDPVYEAIRKGCSESGFRCLRGDDIWEDSVIIQDIFNLIYKSYIVVVDFTGKNPNVMYETGIAHTLGKHVVPISQSISDIPFDMGHHRVLRYLPNGEGLTSMVATLSTRLKQIKE